MQEPSMSMKSSVQPEHIQPGRKMPLHYENILRHASTDSHANNTTVRQHAQIIVTAVIKAGTLFCFDCN